MASVAKRPGPEKEPRASTDYLCYRTKQDGSLCTTVVASPGKACRLHRGKHRALSVRHEGDMPIEMPSSVAAYFDHLITATSGPAPA